MERDINMVGKIEKDVFNGLNKNNKNGKIGAFNRLIT